MIDIAVIYEQPWQQDEDWEALAVPTVKAALLATPFAALNDVDLMIEIAIKLSTSFPCSEAGVPKIKSLQLYNE